MNKYTSTSCSFLWWTFFHLEFFLQIPTAQTECASAAEKSCCADLSTSGEDTFFWHVSPWLKHVGRLFSTLKWVEIPQNSNIEISQQQPQMVKRATWRVFGPSYPMVKAFLALDRAVRGSMPRGFGSANYDLYTKIIGPRTPASRHHESFGPQRVLGRKTAAFWSVKSRCEKCHRLLNHPVPKSSGIRRVNLRSSLQKKSNDTDHEPNWCFSMFSLA